MNGEFAAALLTGLGMMLVLEGLLYAGFPGGLRKMASRLPEIGDSTLRIFGIIAMMIGIAIIWLVR
ncbi:MAG TPA: DUF2065 domain-containing protein [Rhizobiaceae bacterium]|nr:DUF2065 domain-containing protein [Rhizobiaceae bacterium]